MKKNKLRNLSVMELICLYKKLNDKIMPVCVVNITLCIVTLLMRDIYIKWSILSITTIITIYIVTIFIRCRKIRKIIKEKW